MKSHTQWLLGVLGLLLPVGFANAAELEGLVVDAESQEPVELAHVVLLDPSEKSLASELTDERGHFVFRDISPGSYSLAFTRIGFDKFRLDVAVVEGEARTILVQLTSRPFIVTPIVVSASRRKETGIRSPVSTSVVDSARIQETVHFLPVDVVRNEPGLDFRQKGLVQTTFNTRGVANLINITLLVLQDYRYTSMPALKINFPYLLGVTAGDVERIEVSRGPSAALYGPDGSDGVLHIITRSPLDSPGTTISVAGGEQSVFQGWVRHAGILSEKIGYKISAEYFRGEDWDRNFPGIDPDIERATAEARLDWRPDQNTSIILSGGTAHNFHLVDQLPSVLMDAEDLSYVYGQARLHHRRWFANVMFNGNSTGNTTDLLRNRPLVEKSRLVAGQIQHGILVDLGSRLFDLTYGVDHRTTFPRTERTVMGRHEDNDTMTEIGAYVHGKAIVSPKLDVIGAVRGDYHDRISDFAISPRGGVVFQPTPSHAIRATYDRSYASLTAAVLFEDFVFFGDPPFEVRSFGTPKNGLTYRRDCNGPCMRSPFVSGGLDEFVESDATLAWDAIVAMMADEGIDLSQIPSPQGTDQVSTDLRRFEFGMGYTSITPDDIQDIGQPDVEYAETFEVGYKGFPLERIQLGLDVYVRRNNIGWGDFNASTNVFLDAATLEQYLVSHGIPADSAAGLAETMSEIPVGTINPEQVGASSDIYLVPGRFDPEPTPWSWGATASAVVALTDHIEVAGSYIWWEFEPPTHRATARVTYRDNDKGVSASLQGRYRDFLRGELGIWGGAVESFILFDAHVGWRLPWNRNVELTLTANNLFDNEHRQTGGLDGRGEGAVVIGRLLLARMKVDL